MKQLFNKKFLRGVQGGGFYKKSPPGRRRQKLIHLLYSHMSALESPDTNDKVNDRYDQQSNNFRYDIR